MSLLCWDLVGGGDASMEVVFEYRNESSHANDV